MGVVYRAVQLDLEPARRAEADRRRSRRRPGLPRALPARVAAGRADRPSRTSCRCTGRGRRTGSSTSSCATCRAPTCTGCSSRTGRWSPSARPRSICAGGGGARRRARRRARPPRRQARQRADRRRPRVPGRLRAHAPAELRGAADGDRPVARARPTSPPPSSCRASASTRARTSTRSAASCTPRCTGKPAVPARDRARGAARPHPGPGPAAVGAGRAVGLRPRDGACAGEGPGGPLSVGGRPRPRRAGRRARGAGHRVRAQRGGRARGAGAAGNGNGGPPTALTVADVPPTAATRLQEDETTVMPRRRRRRGRRIAGALLAVAVLGGAAVLLGLPGGSPGNDRSRAPLSEDEVRDVAQDFASGLRGGGRPPRCGGRCRRACSACSPAGSRAGARAWWVSTRRSSGRRRREGYELGDLAVQGGRAGRASASYRVERGDGDPIEGQIVLGVVRDRGEPRHRADRGRRPSRSLSRSARRGGGPSLPRRTCVPARRLLRRTRGCRAGRASRGSRRRARLCSSRPRVLASLWASPTRQAGELGDGDALLARDTEGGQRGGAAAGGGGDVDHVGAVVELDAGAELPPLTRAAWPWTFTRAPAGLTVPLTVVVAPCTIAVSTGASTLSTHRLLRPGRRVVGAAAAQEGARAGRPTMRVPSRICGPARLPPALSPSTRLATVSNTCSYDTLSH